MPVLLSNSSRMTSLRFICYYKIFSRYGPLKEVQILQKQALIYFNSQIGALMAKKALNNYKITELDVGFILEFVDPKSVFRMEENAMESKDQGNSKPHESDNPDKLNSILFTKQANKVTLGHQTQTAVANISSKLTCRYDIQIENDREFQVAKKIIGAKGCNMKHIIDGTLLGTSFDLKTENDLIKLRLRGRGSGFKEGPAKRGKGV